MSQEKEIIPEGISKFDVVYEELLAKEEAGEIGFGGEPIWQAPEHVGSWYETCELIVYPTTETFDAEELNRIMFDLTTVQHTCVDTASRHSADSNLALPKLYFDEVLGEMEVDTTLTYTSFQQPKVATPPTEKADSIKTRRVSRRTWVRVYPNQECAQLAHISITEGRSGPPMSSIYSLRPQEIAQLKEKKWYRRPFRR